MCCEDAYCQYWTANTPGFSWLGCIGGMPCCFLKHGNPSPSPGNFGNFAAAHMGCRFRRLPRILAGAVRTYIVLIPFNRPSYIVALCCCRTSCC